MRSFHIFVVPVACAFLVGGLSASRARAQALCGPGFGTTMLELCVTIESGTGTPATVMGTSPLPVGGVSGVPLVVGDYSVALTATLVASGTGIEVNVAGTVERVGSSDPVGTGVTITAEAGRTGALPGGAGFLSLAGTADGVSRIEQGGAAGFPFPAPNGDDLSLTGFPQTLVVELFGAGAFDDSKEAGSVAAGAVAVRSITVVQINDPGNSVMLPSGAGGGEPVFPLGTSREVTIEVEAVPTGNPEHFPIEQFRRAGPDLCPGEHFHVAFGVTTPTSLEGNTFIDNSGCGAGEVDAVRHQTFAVVKNDLVLADDYATPPGEGLFIDDAASLTIPTGITMTTAADSLLVNQGELNVDGFLLIESTAALDNNVTGVVNNAADTISNFGTLNNRGTINNNGTITNQVGGVVNNTGTINGNPIMVPEPPAGLGSLSALLTLCWLGRRRHRAR